MFHPNVYADGGICLDILQNRWSPTYDVSAILTSIQVIINFLQKHVNITKEDSEIILKLDISTNSFKLVVYIYSINLCDYSLVKNMRKHECIKMIRISKISHFLV